MTGSEARRAKPAERLSRPRQRQKLIDACITALHLHGPSRTTIDKVVTIADMSPGIVNFYFETKAALLVAALEYLAVEFETLVLEPVAALRDVPMQALDTLIELYLDPEVASSRKVSVWYSFWGESSSRREYFTICGKHDLAFAALVKDLVGRAIRQQSLPHLDADAIALGLIGCLEMLWQEIAFQGEADVDRKTAKKRCRAYLKSVFPGAPVPVYAGAAAGLGQAADSADAMFRREIAMLRQHWLFACSTDEVARAGDYVAWQSAVGPVLVVCRGGRTVGAYRDACLHRPHRLAPAESGCFGAAIVCAADDSIYTLDGVRTVGGGKLRELSATVDEKAIFVMHESDGAILGARLTLGDFMPSGKAHRFDITADWKAVLLHWADAYFDTSARAFGDNDCTHFGMTDGVSVVQARMPRGNAPGFFKPLYLRLCAAAAAVKVERKLIWPNLFVEARPDGATVRQVLPLAPGRSRVFVRRYAPPAASRDAVARSYLARRIETIWERQDISAVESLQTAQGWQAAGDEPGGVGGLFQGWLGAALAQS